MSVGVNNHIGGFAAVVGMASDADNSRESFAYIEHESSLDQSSPKGRASLPSEPGVLRARRNKTWELEPESSSSLRQTVPYENFESLVLHD